MTVLEPVLLSPTRTRSSRRTHHTHSDNDAQFTSPQRTNSTPTQYNTHNTMLYTPPANRLSYIRGINTELIVRKRVTQQYQVKKLIKTHDNENILPIRRNQHSATKSNNNTTTPLKSPQSSHKHNILSANKLKPDTNHTSIQHTNKTIDNDIDEPDIAITLPKRHIIEQSIDDILELVHKTNYNGFNYTDTKLNKLTLSSRLDRQRKRQLDITCDSTTTTNESNKRVRAKLIFTSPCGVPAYKRARTIQPPLPTVNEIDEINVLNNSNVGDDNSRTD